MNARTLQRFIAVLALLAISSVPPHAAEAKGGRAIAFVSVEGADQVVALDLATGRVVARAQVADGPHNIDWDGLSVVVTSPGAGRVTVLDPQTLRIRRVFSGFGYPHDVEARGRLVFVTDEARGQLDVLDLRTGRIARRIPVGPRPHDLAIVGSRLDRIVVTHRAPRLTLVDLGRRRVVATIRAGGPAHDVEAAPNGNAVYVTYWGSPGVAAVDIRRRHLIWQRRFGVATHHLAFDGEAGRLAVSDHATGRLYLVSPSGHVAGSLRGCPGAHHVAVAARMRLAAACESEDALALFDAAGRTRLIHVGERPHGVVIARVGA